MLEAAAAAQTYYLQVMAVRAEAEVGLLQELLVRVVLQAEVMELQVVLEVLEQLILVQEAEVLVFRLLQVVLAVQV